ncbi:hypothetical protein SAMN04487911_12728 [Arenibacter nanhaiticus]|uniref:DUF3566 domain-containing protein n=1 Tax=Arenibacter nanhaiticus TaxID=558155 RepID=A0A1M6KR35_9FLAO|nr:hypothetical protein [Arenibacter nanhaiticus]SHJ61371.1 hypothetical protein SAMN04487911_12728 [Arenibacter nanhaiticus]
MARLKKINVLALAKFQAVLMAPLGMITGIIYSLGGTLYDIINTGSVNYGTALAYVALVVQPIMFAIVGFLIGIVEALLYNLIAKRFGGMDIELDKN